MGPIATESLKESFRTLTLRDMIVMMISDDHKDLYGFRPRWSWGQMTLVELWAEHKRIYAQLLADMDREECDSYYADYDNDEYFSLAEVEEQFMREVGPNRWDDVADRLEGIRRKR